jgi:hypothetical protein
MECSYAVLSLATVGLLSLGGTIVFTVMAMFAFARKSQDTAKPDLVAVPGDAAAVAVPGDECAAPPRDEASTIK